MIDQPAMVNGANTQPTLSFAFTVQEWAILRAGLYELPVKISGQLIGKLEAYLMQAQPSQLTDEPRRAVQ